MEAADSFKTFITLYHITQHHITKASNLQITTEFSDAYTDLPKSQFSLILMGMFQFKPASQIVEQYHSTVH
jgi:hypothetical protein